VMGIAALNPSYACTVMRPDVRNAFGCTMMRSDVDAFGVP
jgi:hypothetical protein